ncbi:hypothetical protein HRI_004128700 [Hibiscus trionum]|uniref:Uncharacterized protein n=1 Tax=Hibiscus trionum TaxID=183268 RepID=A0A9W7IXX7_HIBTR|nr:hypothetical protein HRI_004128700 [Hibiscus trionum]
MSALAKNMGEPITIISSLFCMCLLLLLCKLWWTPIRIQYRLHMQGIKGPSYKFICGNVKRSLKQAVGFIR